MDEPSKVIPKELFSKFVQIGVVVGDLEKATRNLTEIFGIGPFRVIDWPPEGRPDMLKFYHGQPGEFTARMAFTELGSVELELIQPSGRRKHLEGFSARTRRRHPPYSL